MIDSTFVVSSIWLAIVLMELRRTLMCSAKYGHCSCQICAPGNRLPTAMNVRKR